MKSLSRHIYTLGIYAYGGLLRVASLWHPKARKMTEGRRHTEDVLQLQLQGGSCDVWIHSASLGEFEQAMPVIDRILARNPSAKIVLSFYSPSGYEVCRKRNLPATLVYLPLDTPGKMRRFVEQLSPRCAIIIKYEFWANMLEQLRRQEVPTYLVSAIFRPTQPFFKPWGGLWRNMLRSFTGIFVQDEASAQLLKGKGIDNVTVAGDTRFDRVAAIRERAKTVPEVEAFREEGRPLLVFGSSWPQDEALYLPWLSQHPEVKAVIAPHEWDAARLERLAAIHGAVLYSQKPSTEQLKEARVLVLDTFGLLSSVYRYATAAYIGGGFGAGIHNINEAAIYGIPVGFGPKHGKFKEATDLLAAGAALEVTDRTTMAAALEIFTSDEPRRQAMGRAADEYERQNIGASDTIYNQIFDNKL